MSAAVMSFGVEIRIPESGPVRLHDSGMQVDVDSADAPPCRNSRESNGPGLCYEAASEADLVAAAKSGDQHAFTELHRRYRPLLKRRIRGIVRNLQDAEDVLQDTMISAFRHLPRFRVQCSFRTWITTIATNTSLMLLRKRKNRPETGYGIVTAEGNEVEVIQISDPMPNPEEVYARRQASHKVSEAVRMLPPGFRLLVERYHQDEVKLVDAAHAMGITEGAAKSRLLRARKVLRRHLHNDRSRYLD